MCWCWYIADPVKHSTLYVTHGSWNIFLESGSEKKNVFAKYRVVVQGLILVTFLCKCPSLRYQNSPLCPYPQIRASTFNLYIYILKTRSCRHQNEFVHLFWQSANRQEKIVVTHGWINTFMLEGFHQVSCFVLVTT